MGAWQGLSRKPLSCSSAMTSRSKQRQKSTSSKRQRDKEGWRKRRRGLNMLAPKGCLERLRGKCRSRIFMAWILGDDLEMQVSTCPGCGSNFYSFYIYITGEPLGPSQFKTQELYVLFNTISHLAYLNELWIMSSFSKAWRNTQILILGVWRNEASALHAPSVGFSCCTPAHLYTRP